ncbi:MAG: capsule assembly Wzi family protein, partial [Gammaproteobacteria bacterium]|nr:capsule assembly Wzi family protein [Gammaproteobacteria bacterium]
AQTANPERVPDEVAAALMRVKARIRAERATGYWRLHTEASVGSEPRLIRDFEDLPREKGEIAAGVERMGDLTAVKLVAQYVADPEDDRELRYDGSYVGIALGNWMLAGAITDRWWGPGWQGSMILSNNARPIPAFTIDRNSTAPFESKWLRWIGSWDLVSFFGYLEDDRAVPDARLFGIRFTARPASWLEVGLSRTAMWCGRDRPCDFDTFVDLLAGNDNAGQNVNAEDEPGNQLAGYDIRLNGGSFGIPFAIYTQRIGEDEQDGLPSLFLTQVGLETWGRFEALGDYRLYLEVSDTLCGGNITGGGQADVCYEHPIYATGYRYRDRAIGHSFDNDAEIWTLGALLNDRRDGAWVGSIAFGDLNREGNPSVTNTVAAVETRYLSVNLSHRRPLPLGELQAAVGLESFDNRVTGATDEEFRASLNWRHVW